MTDTTPQEPRPSVTQSPVTASVQALEPSSSVYASAASFPASPARSKIWAPYAIGAVVAALVLVLVYQQSQISRLSQDLSTVTDSVKSSDIKSRLDAEDAKLSELNTRLSYLDSKIVAVDQKAQSSLDKWHAQETKGNFFTDIIKNVQHSLGFK